MSDIDLRIGLFYGSTTCYTEMAAEKIQTELNSLFSAAVVDVHNIATTALKHAEDYDIVIFGISTWDFGELQEDWESSWEDVYALQLNDKVVALYGLGDQLGYGDWFQDALGMLHNALVGSGCTFIGKWPNQGYSFNASKALVNDGQHFVGLSLDDENQFDQTDERIAQWCRQLTNELGIA